MKSDFYMAITQIAAERGIPREAVIESVEHAIRKVYRKTANIPEPEEGAVDNVDVAINPGDGGIRVFVRYTIADQVKDQHSQIALQDALRLDPDAWVGKILRIDRTPKDFGRIAAQTAKQVVLQRIRDYERSTVYDEYKERVGEIMTGIIQRTDQRTVIVGLGKTEAVMPVREQVAAERYRPGQRLQVYLKEVNPENRGPLLIVSRTDPALVRRLFEREVPEIHSGAVEIRRIAREPGLRSKVAVAARQEKVDPVGSCVGVRGVRIQNIVNELMGEKIDVIEYSPDIQTFIANALSPAKPISVTITDNPEPEDMDDAQRAERSEETEIKGVARVVVPTDQMSLAIGKEGQNARLAFKLTRYRIDVKDPESIREEDRDLLSEARAAINDTPDDFMMQGRQPRLVRTDGTFVVREREFGPLPAELVGMSVDVEVVQNVLLVHHNRILQARYDFESGDTLPLYDEEVAI